MSILRFIPKVGYCCCFIRLVDGCYFTAFFCMYGMLDYTFGVLSTHISHCWEDEDPLQDFTGYFGYFMAFVSIVVAVFGGIFIWGVRKDKPFTAVWYMCALGAKSLGLCAFGILLIIANLPERQSSCEIPVVKIMISFFLFLLHLYFIIVVRSYYPQMAAQAALNAPVAPQPVQPIAVDTRPNVSPKKAPSAVSKDGIV